MSLPNHLKILTIISFVFDYKLKVSINYIFLDFKRKSKDNFFDDLDQIVSSKLVVSTSYQSMHLTKKSSDTQPLFRGTYFCKKLLEVNNRLKKQTSDKQMKIIF